MSGYINRQDDYGTQRLTSLKGPGANRALPLGLLGQDET